VAKAEIHEATTLACGALLFGTIALWVQFICAI
jgi:hypothetical protein